jgi:hypothetical protein
MQRAGIISPSFPAKVHLTKVAPAVVDRPVEINSEPNMAIKCVKVTNMPLCAAPNAEVKLINMTDVPKCSVPNRDRKCVNMTSKSDNLVIRPSTVKRTTVAASTVGQTKGSCL